MQTMTPHLIIEEASTHNLKNISLALPLNRWIAITGPSGAGKTSLAFGTLFAEGQARYLETLAPSLKRLLPPLPHPPLKSIEGLPPTVAIRGEKFHDDEEETVGSLSEIHDAMQLLALHHGVFHCPKHQLPLKQEGLDPFITSLVAHFQGMLVALLAPLRTPQEQPCPKQISLLMRRGFYNYRCDGVWIHGTDLERALNAREAELPPPLLELVVDRLRCTEDQRPRLKESLELALSLSGGRVQAEALDHPSQQISLKTAPPRPSPKPLLYTSAPECPQCGWQPPQKKKENFSFHHPEGACPCCSGRGKLFSADLAQLLSSPQRSLREEAILGWGEEGSSFERLKQFSQRRGFSLDQPYQSLSDQVKQMLWEGEKGEGNHLFQGILPFYNSLYRKKTLPLPLKKKLAGYFKEKDCAHCQGNRIDPKYGEILIGGLRLIDWLNLPITSLQKELASYAPSLALKGDHWTQLLLKITDRCEKLAALGLGYLTLNRAFSSLSGGEQQRVQLFRQLNSPLTGLLYLIETPSLGLHLRDLKKLLGVLHALKAKGNSLIVVDHHELALMQADLILELGAGSGHLGGSVVACEPPERFKYHPNASAAPYLLGQTVPPPKATTVPPSRGPWVELKGASGKTLKHLTFRFPKGRLTCLSGVSGSGKSTLLHQTLYPAALKKLGKKSGAAEPYLTLQGMESFHEVQLMASNRPVPQPNYCNSMTYLGFFKSIRELFAEMAEARAQGFPASDFSLNKKGGRCENCLGEGTLKLSLPLLPEAQAPCPACQGKQFQSSLLKVHYRGKNIAEVLKLTVSEALDFFKAFPQLTRYLVVLKKVGLETLPLGQPLNRLSHGEFQKLKWAKMLSKKREKSTLFLLDEPMRSLSLPESDHLFSILSELRHEGHTLLMVEHHPRLLLQADWLVELGPGGGEEGGNLLFQGAPREFIEKQASPTAEELRSFLQTLSKNKEEPNQ